MIKKSSKGFTLIELLVVIAIIGILAATVLASLSSARSKGNDAKVKSQLSSTRAAAEIYYSTNSNYGGATDNTCAAGVWADSTSGLLGLTTSSNFPSGTTIACHSNGTAWAVAASLSGTGAWCVDSTGASRGTVGSTTTAYTNTSLTGSSPAPLASGTSTACQ